MITNLDFYRDASRDSTSEDEGVYSLRPHGPASTISAPEILMSDDITPKHYIRTPILEETESNMEAELISRHMSREHDRYSFSQIAFRSPTATGSPFGRLLAGDYLGRLSAIFFIF